MEDKKQKVSSVTAGKGRNVRGRMKGSQPNPADVYAGQRMRKN